MNICNLGGCLCLRCLIPKDWLQNLETERDTLQCQVLACKDDQQCREKVAAACRLIYDQQYVVDTPQVEKLLKEESLVPTKVWDNGLLDGEWLLMFQLECIFCKA